jgi:hypothetical protein
MASLFVFYAIACHFVLKFFRIKKFSRGLYLWIILAVLTAGVVYENYRPLPTNIAESQPVKPDVTPPPDITLDIGQPLAKDFPLGFTFILNNQGANLSHCELGLLG